MTQKFIRLMTLWLWGGFGFYCIECIWRGYSHWSMFILGGICFLVIGGLNNYLPWEMPILKQMLIGGVIVTVFEFFAGLILNGWLGWGIWDYSNLPFNIMGQISLPFTIIWVILSGVAIWLDDFLRWKLFDERHPQYNFH
jgi:hypothetical protein